MDKLEQAFVAEMAKKTEQARAAGVDGGRTLAALEKQGPARLLGQQARRGCVSAEFETLAAAGRLDLSLEAAAVQGRYGALFDDDTVNFCLQVLCEKGYFAL